MKAENLVDALGHLDDDILEEADAFRSRKRSYRRIWIPALAAAACLCIAFIGVHGAFNAELLVSPDRGADVTTGYSSGSSDDISISGKGNYFTGATTGVSSQFRYYAQITEWAEDGFYAVITGTASEYADELEKGDRVKVQLDSPVVVSKNQGDKQYYQTDTIPDEKDFPVESFVEFELNEAESCIGDSKADFKLWIYMLGDIAPQE